NNNNNNNNDNDHSSSIKLPDLFSYPKGFPSPHGSEFVVRSQVLQLFYALEQQDQHGDQQVVTNRNGFYLTGPWGVGKSTGMYFLACLAVVKGWVTIYVPTCDEWAAISKKEDRAKYFIRAMA
ncbi:hypothetical protein HMI54_014241, partial [Coelomomyces lativittatus]